MALSYFLSNLLQSIYDSLTESITFCQGIDAADAVESYNEKGYLKPTTLFATFSIENFYSTFTHKEILLHMEYFLYDYVPQQQVEGIRF